MIYKLYYELKQKAPFEVLFVYMQQYDFVLALFLNPLTVNI